MNILKRFATGDKLSLYGENYVVSESCWNKESACFIYKIDLVGADDVNMFVPEYLLINEINKRAERMKREYKDVTVEGVGNSKPHHYSKGIDAWDIVDLTFTEEQKTGFDVGNILQYILRYDKKDGVKDLKKARDYLDRLIKRMEETE